MTWVNGHKKLLFCLAVFMIIMMPASAQASQTSGYDQIQMKNYPLARQNGNHVNPKKIVSVGISADQQDIYVRISMDINYAHKPWTPYDNYQLAIAGHSFNFSFSTFDKNGNFSVISGGKNIGSGNSLSTDNPTWQFAIGIKEIQTLTGMDIPENAQLSLQNANLYQGAATISYAGSPTGPWLLAGIGMTIAVGGYFFNSRVRVKKQANQLTGTTYA